MTEAEWLACDDPASLLEFLEPEEDARKTRLMKCACCRLLWPLLVDPRSRFGIETAEGFADGAVTLDELNDGILRATEAARANVRNVDLMENWDKAYARSIAIDLAKDVTSNTELLAVGVLRCTIKAQGVASDYALGSETSATIRDAHRDEVEKRTSDLLRMIAYDVFGNPFRPVAFEPAWRTSTAVALARQMYDSRDFGLMPILGDALQDAGCDSADILDHCRGDGPHVRGCWVVDLVLGKA